ncbi:MAG: hypothetical protein ACRENE_13880, partial [Polyangiaceae bacterium]
MSRSGRTSGTKTEDEFEDWAITPPVFPLEPPLGPGKIEDPSERQPSAAAQEDLDAEDGPQSYAREPRARRRASNPQEQNGVALLLTADEAAALLRTSRKAIYAMA